MNRICWHTSFAKVHSLLLALSLLLSLSSCTVADLEYSQRLRNARNDCTGNEIVGVWVSKIKVLGMEGRHTQVFRPDGTGIHRQPHMEQAITWRYLGNGSWQGEFIGTIKKFFIRLDGQCLLMEIRGLGGAGQFVFVRADNDAAVDEHLRKRQ